MPCPPDSLVTPSELPRYGVPSAFTGQFVPVTIDVLILAGGTLGSMAIQWRPHGDLAWTNRTFTSTAGASWPVTIDDAFIDLTFAAGNYVTATTYTVDTTGAVTQGAGAIAGVSASRFDLRANACSAVTGEALLLMEDAVTQPLLSWGDDAKTHAAAWVHAILKRSKGVTANGAGLGDEVIFVAEAKAQQFFEMIGKKGRPANMVDSSTTGDGPMLAAYPISDDTRGW